MVIDPPEDQVMVLLDALEFAIDKGNLEDARKRIRALRKLRRQEKGYPGV
jgi:5-bromo-4-chloroindolyl phosphate hydrolysis protein